MIQRMKKLRTNERWLDRFGVLFLAIVLASIAVWAIVRPVYNWDILPYVAIASEAPSMDATARHANAYRFVEAAAPAHDWAVMTQANTYRIAMFSNPEAFDSQLAVYRIKPGYTLAGRALAMVMPAPGAFRAVNVIALAALFAVVAVWMFVGGFGRTAFFVVPIFVLAGLPVAGRMVTPDVLCAALALAGLVLIRWDRWLPAALCFATATATRPDFILFPAAVVVVALLARNSWRGFCACFVASLAGYGIAMLVGGFPGWWPHFTSALIELRQDYGDAPPFSIEAYLAAVRGAWLTSATERHWPFLILLLGAVWLALRDRPTERIRQADVLVGGLMLSVAARCVIFPLPDERLYLPTIMMLAMLVAERWSQWTSRLPTGIELQADTDHRRAT
jgi:hypothetical protein